VATADRGLEVETEERPHFGQQPAVLDQRVVARLAQGAETR
jgi:hypothetical protein